MSEQQPDAVPINTGDYYAYGTGGKPTRNIVVSFNSDETRSTISSGDHSDNNHVTNGSTVLGWFSCFGGFFNKGPSLIDEDEEEGSTRRRSLSTLTGVFSPVAIGMFSTLLFIRIGKSSLTFAKCFSLHMPTLSIVL